MGTVTPFPRAARALDNLDREALLCRCRIKARLAGCNQAQRAVVAHAAGIAFDKGGSRVSIIEAACALARQLSHSAPVPY